MYLVGAGRRTGAGRGGWERDAGRHPSRGDRPGVRSGAPGPRPVRRPLRGARLPRAPARAGRRGLRDGAVRGPMEMIGRVTIELAANASVPDFDLWAQLYDVAPDGTAWNLSTPGTARPARELSGWRPPAEAGCARGNRPAPNGPPGDGEPLPPRSPTQVGDHAGLRPGLLGEPADRRPRVRQRQRPDRRDPARAFGRRVSWIVLPVVPLRLMWSPPTLRTGPPDTAVLAHTGCHRCALVGRRPPDRRPAG